MGFDSPAQDMNGNVMNQGMQGQDFKQMMINGGAWPMEGDDGSNGGYHGGGYHGAAYDYGAQAAYNQYGGIPGNNYGASGASAAKMVRCAPERSLPMRNCALLPVFSVTNTAGCVVMNSSPKMIKMRAGCSRAQLMVAPSTAQSTTRTSCKTMLQLGTFLSPRRAQLATDA